MFVSSGRPAAGGGVGRELSQLGSASLGAVDAARVDLVTVEEITRTILQTDVAEIRGVHRRDAVEFARAVVALLQARAAEAGRGAAGWGQAGACPSDTSGEVWSGGSF